MMLSQTQRVISEVIWVQHNHQHLWEIMAFYNPIGSDETLEAWNVS